MEVHCSPHSPTGQGGAGLRDLTFEPGTAACIHHLRQEVCVCVCVCVFTLRNHITHETGNVLYTDMYSEDKLFSLTPNQVAGLAVQLLGIQW